MGKIKKLVRNPALFFVDAISKRKPKLPSIILGNVNLYKEFTHVLHSGEKEKSGLSHLDLWIPYFIQSDVELLVLVRNVFLFYKLKEKYPTINIVFAAGHNNVKHIIDRLIFIEACFYPSNTGNNIHLLQYNNIKHIFLGHGDSDKSASAHKYFRVYDENWVSGQAHIDRFKNAGFNSSGLKHVCVGRPTTLDILKKSTVQWRERFKKEINILYLSTWEGVYSEQDYTSVYIIEEILTRIKNKAENIRIKFHPSLGSRNKNLIKIKNKIKNKNVVIYNNDVLIKNIIVKSNIFICDISAVISDCLPADAPIFVYKPKNKQIKLSESNMKFDDYTYVFSTALELEEKMSILLSGDDYLSENRKKAIEYISGGNATLNERFLKEVKLIGKKDV